MKNAKPMSHGLAVTRAIALWLASFSACIGIQAHAQDSLTYVYTLGTQAGPIPTASRGPSANVVAVGQRLYLVDAGNGVARALAQAGLDYRRIDQIFITHNHDDHNADWGTLMGLQWSTGRRSPVTVYGPKGTESMLKGFLQYFEPNAQIRNGDSPMPVSPAVMFRAKDIAHDGVIFQDAQVKVLATEVCHFHFSPQARITGGPHKAFAFRFETKDRIVVFSGDTGPCPALVNFAKGADVLVHEVIDLPSQERKLRQFLDSLPDKPSTAKFQQTMRHMVEDHTSPEEVGKLATAAGVKKVVLSHLSPGGDEADDAAYVNGVKAYFDGPVVAAKDLMRF